MPARSWADIRRVLPLFTSVFTFLNDLVPVFYQYGARRVRRVPFAYCRYTHLQTDVHRAPDGHLYYFGTYGPTVERWLMPLARFNLVIHGHGWSRASSPELRKASMHSIAIDSQMCKAAEGQLVVNFIRAEHGSGHSMKTFELPAAGACVITNRSEEQLEFFPEGSGVGYFNTAGEMTGLVVRFMEDPCRITAAIGKRDVYLAGHSYHERVETLLDEIEDSFDGRNPAVEGSDGQCTERLCACRRSR
jgi:spore maturation protein CgeB